MQVTIILVPREILVQRDPEVLLVLMVMLVSQDLLDQQEQPALQVQATFKDLVVQQVLQVKEELLESLVLRVHPVNQVSSFWEMPKALLSENQVLKAHLESLVHRVEEVVLVSKVLSGQLAQTDDSALRRMHLVMLA